MTQIINLFGGPGTGKSTTAAHLFALLKQDGVNAELVTEYAKDKVWEESFKVLGNQIYIFGKQYHKMFRLLGKVDVIVTDSPLLNSLYYSKGENQTFSHLILDRHCSMANLNFFLKRVKPYQAAGRMQTAERAAQMDDEIKQMLDYNFIDYHEVVADKDAAEKIRTFAQLFLHPSTV